MNDTIKNIISRRSCKSYKEDMVPNNVIDEIVEAGLYAASGMGKQSPVVIVVTNRDVRNKLSRLNAKYDPMKRPDPFYSAPVILCVAVPKDCPTGVEDGSLVIGNMMLAAHSLGIGSCWIHRAREVFEDEEGAALLKEIGLDETYRGIGNCAIGYPLKINNNSIPRRDNRVYRI